MLGTFTAQNRLDEEGRPAGGYVYGTGLTISWQDGPLGRDENRFKPNGAFVETVIAGVIQRIAHYQEHFPCEENGIALLGLDQALDALNGRTQRREAAKTEGTYGRDDK